MLRTEPEKLFVFGDNLARKGMGGQAREMRGESNAVGLPTKRSWFQFLSDDDFDEVREAARIDISRLMIQLHQNKIVVWPAAGIGTGFGKLEKYAPKIKHWYDELLSGMENFKNQGI